MTTATMSKHVAALCAAFGIRPVVNPAMPPHAAATAVPARDRHKHSSQQRYKSIMIAPVNDESTYAAALHELGHWLSPLGSVAHDEGSPQMRLFSVPATERDVRLLLECERAAWEWARVNALDWTPTMQYVQDFALGSYEAKARRSRRTPPPSARGAGNATEFPFTRSRPRSAAAAKEN